MTAQLSRNNPRVKRLARLARDRRARRDEQVLVVDGPRALRTFLDAGAVIEAVFTDDASRDDLSFVERELLSVVDRHVLDRISDATGPQGVLAIAAAPECSLADLTGHRLVVVLDAIQDPGNVGAVIRVAAATGAAVVCGIGCADPFSPRAVRASAGTVAAISVVVDLPAMEALHDLGASGFWRVATAMSGGVDPSELDKARRMAVVFGSEGSGLSEAAASEIDSTVTLSMLAPVESLNVAVTAGIILYQLRSVD